MKAKLLIATFMVIAVCYSCKKWQDPPQVTDPRITERKYCNDPAAVNYNWNFPGTPDSTTCFYPSDIFVGDYLFTDSIYRSDNSFDSAASLQVYTLHLFRLSKNKLAVVGFCMGGDSLRFTAERTTYKAYADSTIRTSDTTYDYGQYFCSMADTLTGNFYKQQTDTLGTHLFIDFTVVSDTGVDYHRGTAIKQ